MSRGQKSTILGSIFTDSRYANCLKATRFVFVTCKRGCTYYIAMVTRPTIASLRPAPNCPKNGGGAEFDAAQISRKHSIHLGKGSISNQPLREIKALFLHPLDHFRRSHTLYRFSHLTTHRI